MESHIWGLAPTRRDFMLSSVALAGALSLPAGLLAVTQAIAAGEIKDVPRNRTLVTVRGGTEGKHTEYDLWSPYVIGSNPQLGGNIIYEPLAFYSAFADKTIMWLAESYKYSPDYKELTVKTRSGITWSDGKPFSAEDVAYSLNTLNELGGKVKWGKDVQEVLDSATVGRSQHDADQVQGAVAALLLPHALLQIRYRPAHRSQAHLRGPGLAEVHRVRPRQGLAGHHGPVEGRERLADPESVRPQGLLVGRRRGVGKLPAVERIVLLPDTGEQQLAQGLISNAVDFSTGLQVATFPTVFKGNPNIITFTGRELPYGNVDWWPTSLYLNNERRAVQQSEVPLGDQLSDRPTDADRRRLGRLRRACRRCRCRTARSTRACSPISTTRSRCWKSIRPTNSTRTKGAALLAELGWKKDGSGMYLDPSGKPFTLEIISFFDFPSVGPVLVELLKRQGMNATYGQPPDMFDRYFAGNYNGGDFRSWRQRQRSLCDAAALPIVVRGDPRRPSGQPVALEERRI